MMFPADLPPGYVRRPDGSVPAPLPPDERARLLALADLRVLDSPPEAAFDRITALAARLLRAPLAFITLVDRERQWFKSCHGLKVDGTPRDVSFCAHALLERRPFVVRDARLDPRFAENPLVVGAPYIRLYAGAPIRDAAGAAYGTLCVVDHTPRDLYTDDLANLVALSEIAGDALFARRKGLDASEETPAPEEGGGHEARRAA